MTDAATTAADEADTAADDAADVAHPHLENAGSDGDPDADRDALRLPVARRLRWLMRLMRFYPPYLGASVRATAVNETFTTIDVAMPLRLTNRNFFGTHFGGSLYAMCDPWFVFILYAHLGDDHVVWDRAARIVFQRPGRGRVTARFHVPAREIARLRAAAAVERKVEPVYTVDVVDAKGAVVAQIEKTLYVRHKEAHRRRRASRTNGQSSGDDASR
ncbi:MAG: DUF4442 domain-containing protein [Acidobacteriota bacterium]